MALLIIDTELSNIDSRDYSRGFIKELEINIKALVELESPNQSEYFTIMTKQLTNELKLVNQAMQEKLDSVTKENEALKTKVKHWEEFNTARCLAGE